MGGGSKVNAEFWGLESDNYLTWTSIEDRVSDYLELCLLDEVEPEKTLVLIGYVRATPDIQRIAEYTLYKTTEMMDEKYTENISNEMLEKDLGLLKAAEKFVKAIVEKYEVEKLTRFCEKIVLTQDYI